MYDCHPWTAALVFVLLCIHHGNCSSGCTPYAGTGFLFVSMSGNCEEQGEERHAPTKPTVFYRSRQLLCDDGAHLHDISLIKLLLSVAYAPPPRTALSASPPTLPTCFCSLEPLTVGPKRSSPCSTQLSHPYSVPPSLAARSSPLGPK
jgi:hypothetical protein